MRNNKFLSGSLTIELSLLMPLIIAVITSIIFLSYYIHDKCILENEAYFVAMKMSEESDNEGQSLDLKSIEKKTIGHWKLTGNVEYSDDEVSVHISGNMDCFDAFNLHIISNGLFNVNINESVSYIDEVKYIRDALR